MITPTIQEELVKTARAMTQNAYAPYSAYRVGAAVLTKEGNIFGGCNVENVSYGLCVCAERNAIGQAIAVEGPSMRLEAIVVLNGQESECTPCGACRQVIAEFGDKVNVFYQGGDGLISTHIYTLLPSSFDFEKE